MSLNDPLPAPVVNDRRPICELVIEDIRERQEYGTRKYGTPLQAGNGRPPIIDVYQEALDLVIYLRQYIEEQKLGIGDVRAHEYENDRLRVENEQLQRNLLKWIEANNAATILIHEQWAENERLRGALQAEERARENEMEYAAADAHSLKLQAYRWPSLRCINDALDDLREHWHEMMAADQAQVAAQFDLIMRHQAEQLATLDHATQRGLESRGLRVENKRLREALEAMDTKLEVESTFEEKGETYVAFYRVPAGPWHKILGLIR